MVDLLLDSLCQEKELKNDMMEKESPLVSVIIPVYNAEKYLNAALNLFNGDFELYKIYRQYCFVVPFLLLK